MKEAGVKMPVAQALRRAEKFLSCIEPYCDRTSLAGSVRRGGEKGFCSDVDVVVIHKRQPGSLEFFEQELKEALPSLLHRHLVKLTDNRSRFNWLKSRDNSSPESGSFYQIRVDDWLLEIYCATLETWGSVLACRTGSADANRWLALWAKGRGLQWRTSRGLQPAGAPEDAPCFAGASEESFFAELGFPFVPDPKARTPEFYEHIFRSLAPGVGLVPQIETMK
jgi:DNA polymerase/3'-5' exonuclease PolX